MQEQEIIVDNKFDNDDIKKLIENSNDENYLTENNDTINNLVTEASKANEKDPEIIIDNGESKANLDRCNMFHNVDALKNACTRYFSQTGYARQIGNLLRGNFSEIAPINRDLAKYFVTLKGTDNNEKVKKCLQYINAMERRNTGIQLSNNKTGQEKENIINEYFEESRQILDELIDTFNKEKNTYNLDDENELYDYFVHTAKSFLIGEFFDYDHDYIENLKKTDPKIFYNTRQLANIYEYMQSNLADDMAYLTGIRSKNVDLQLKASTLIPTLDTTTNLLEQSTSTKRNLYTILDAIMKSNFTNEKKVYLNLDMKSYGLIGLDNNLDYEPLFKDKSIEELAKVITNIDPGREYDIYDFDNETHALTSASMMLDDYIQTIEKVDLIEDMLKESGMDSSKDKTNYFLGTIYVNDKSLKDIVSEYSEGEELNISNTKAIASAILAKAINDPNKVLSLVTVKLNEDNVIEPNVITLEKNYDRLKERCKDHNLWDKFLHLFGYKYPEEKLLKNHNEFKKTFNIAKTQEIIMKNFEENNEDITSKFNVKLTLNNVNELANLTKAKNIEVAELNNQPKIEDLDEELDKVSEKVAVKD